MKDGAVTKVSVVLPTVGKNKEIKKAINSILNQSYGTLELIIVNDSKDLESRNYIYSLADEFRDSRITILDSTARCPAGSRNIGIRESSGDIIFFCDDDDIWSRDKVEKQLILMETTGANFHLSNFEIVSENGECIRTIQKECVTMFPHSLMLDFFAPPSGWAIKRGVFSTCGYFDENFLSAEDKEFILRASKSFFITRSGPPIWQYRISESALSRNVRRKIYYNVKLINKIRKDVTHNGDWSYGMIKFIVKVAIASKKPKVARLLVRFYLGSDASHVAKSKMVGYFFAFYCFRRRIERDVS